MSNGFAVGDMVELRDEGTHRAVGVVSEPITDAGSGHVLTLQDGCLIGMTASIEDVRAAGEKATGFAQLAHSLIKLASHVIDRRLIV